MNLEDNDAIVIFKNYCSFFLNTKKKKKRKKKKRMIKIVIKMDQPYVIIFHHL